MIDPNGPDPLYLQLAAILRERIRDGSLPMNRPIPSTLQLQQEFGLARGTILHAVEVLRGEGLVRVVQGRGTYVIAMPPAGGIEPDE